MQVGKRHYSEEEPHCAVATRQIHNWPKETLRQRPALLPKQLAMLNVKVHLVHDNTSEIALTCGVEKGSKGVRMVDKEWLERNTKSVSQ